MITIRPDAEELLTDIHTLVAMLRNDDQPETRKQNLDRMERIVDMLASSLEDRPEG